MLPQHCSLCPLLGGVRTRAEVTPSPEHNDKHCVEERPADSASSEGKAFGLYLPLHSFSLSTKLDLSARLSRIISIKQTCCPPHCLKTHFVTVKRITEHISAVQFAGCRLHSTVCSVQEPALSRHRAAHAARMAMLLPVSRAIYNMPALWNCGTWAWKQSDQQEVPSYVEAEERQTP